MLGGGLDAMRARDLGAPEGTREPLGSPSLTTSESRGAEPRRPPLDAGSESGLDSD
jgi:hypothetical protein